MGNVAPPQSELSRLTRAVLAEPNDAPSHAHLAYAMLVKNDFEAAHVLYRKAIELDPQLAIAYHGLAELHGKMGDEAGSATYRSRGLRLRPVTTLRYDGTGRAIDVLLLGAQGSSNIDTKRFFDPQLFRVHALAVEFFPPGRALPPFDVCFNAIGEADSAHAALVQAKDLVAGSSARILNHPDVVLRTGRIAISQLLRAINGVRTPRIVRVARQELARECIAATLGGAELAYPFLLRTPGQHTGANFLKISQPSDVDVALQTLPGNEFFAIEFLDARGHDGLIRKYRVIAVAGKLYPIHLAVSTQWKVHYFSAGTATLAVHRAEEERFLESMDHEFGELTMARLSGIVQLLGLDYGGVDFSVAQDGTLLIYEANATMGFAEPSSDAQAAYRAPAMQRVRQAITMLLR